MFVIDAAALARNAARLYLEGKPTGASLSLWRRKRSSIFARRVRAFGLLSRQ
jgi:hypothetical protein